ncbi:MAG: DUF3520 domain-containing protein, partial [Acidobacteria bacterium]
MQGNTPESWISAVRSRCTSDSSVMSRFRVGTRNLNPALARKDRPMRKLIFIGLAVVLITGAFAGLAAEKPKSGGLVVTVSDEVGPLPGAIVTISHDTGFIKTTSVQADVKGQVSFPVLRPGTGYRIEVRLSNYGTQVITNITIKAGESVEIPVILVQEMVETVKVVAEGRVVKLEETQKTTKFSEEFVQDLPVPGRFYQNVLTLAPGVQDADGDGNPNVHGSRDRDFKAIVSGVSNVDPLIGQQMSWGKRPGNTEAYDEIVENIFRSVATTPLSTFSIDVDTASYSNVRRLLNQGVVPPPGAVRIEELINYFNYDYPQPDGNVPFGIGVEISEAPWNPRHRLVRIGLKGKELRGRERPACNLVFLIDVSGSMNTPNKLPLVQRSMRMLVNELNARDQVSIVVYAGAAGLVLEPTPASDRETILRAIQTLRAGGSTAGGAGIQLAYQQARRSFIEGGVNRVVLATDGDFNVGISDRSSLVRLIEKEADTGIFLTILGYGMGNLKDSLLEQLADHGNGMYAYIDNLREARKVLVEEAGSTLIAIAKDVKIQVEFNPAEVASYRLIGYENRALRDEDFNDDTKDAGEIGAGHTVTALYEIVPHGVGYPTPFVDPLKYRQPWTGPPALTEAAASGELLTVKIRWKDPDGTRSRLQELAVVDSGRRLSAASDDFRFAAAVAAFGMLLRDSEFAGDMTFDDVRALAENGL